MLNIKVISGKDSIIGVWKVAENEDSLWELIDDRFRDEKLLNIQNDKNRILGIAVRVLLSKILNDYDIPCGNLKKDEYGKPYLEDSDYSVSFSHTKNFVAVILSKNNFIGIDIETKMNQAFRIKSKFLSAKELIEVKNNERKATILWSAKEAIYKAYGKKELIFKKDMQLETWQKENLEINFSKIDQNIIVEYQNMEDYILTYICSDVSNF